MAGELNNEAGAITKEQAETLLKGKSPMEIFLWVAKEINTYSKSEWKLLDDVIYGENNENNELFKTAIRSEIEQKGVDKIITGLSKENDRTVINSRYPIVLLKNAMDLELTDKDKAKFVEFVKAKDPIAFYVIDTQFSGPLVEKTKNSITIEELRAGANNSGPRHLIEAMGYLPLEFTEKELPQLLANSIKNSPNHNFSGINDKFSAENNAQLAVKYKYSIENGLERIARQHHSNRDIAEVRDLRSQLLEIPEIKKVYEMAAASEKISLNSPAAPEAQAASGQDKASLGQANQVYAFMQDAIAAQQANQAPSQG